MEIPALADLLDVQELDLEIDRLLHRRATLPELERYRAAQEQIDALDEQISKLSDEVRQLELSVISRGSWNAGDEAAGQETRLFAGGMSARDREHAPRVRLAEPAGTHEERILGLLDELDPKRRSWRGCRERQAPRRRTRSRRSSRRMAADRQDRSKNGKRGARPDTRRSGRALREAEETKEVAVGWPNTTRAVGVTSACRRRRWPRPRERPPRCVHCRRILII